MRITEAQAISMGLKLVAGNWVKSTATEIIESSNHGSNHGMASARGFLRGNGRAKSSPEQVRADIISSARKMGMNEAEATAFAEMGRRGH
jgi:hypothetical protein